MDKILQLMDHKKQSIELEFKTLNNELSFLDPMIEEAERTLLEIQRSEITEIRSFSAPPSSVELVMNAVCAILGENHEWQNVKAMIGDY